MEELFERSTNVELGFCVRNPRPSPRNGPRHRRHDMCKRPAAKQVQPYGPQCLEPAAGPVPNNKDGTVNEVADQAAGDRGDRDWEKCSAARRDQVREDEASPNPPAGVAPPASARSPSFCSPLIATAKGTAAMATATPSGGLTK